MRAERGRGGMEEKGLGGEREGRDGGERVGRREGGGEGSGGGMEETEWGVRVEVILVERGRGREGMERVG